MPVMFTVVMGVRFISANRFFRSVCFKEPVHKKDSVIIFFSLAWHSALHENILVTMYTYYCYLLMFIFILTMFIVILYDSSL